MSEENAKPEKAPDKEKEVKKKEEPQVPKYTGYDYDCFLAPQELLKAVTKLDHADFFLEDVSCVDMQEGFQVVYHFDRFSQPGRVVLRVMISRENPEIPSIYDIFPGAAWHERECFDFFGVRFTGHPNLIPLLLDPEHQGPPPLLKEETALKDLNQLYPDRVHTPVSPDSEEFVKEINNCSNQKSRNQS